MIFVTAFHISLSRRFKQFFRKKDIEKILPKEPFEFVRVNDHAVEIKGLPPDENRAKVYLCGFDERTIRELQKIGEEIQKKRMALEVRN